MTLTHLLLLLPIAQGTGPAPGEVGKFQWPPAADKTLHYTATFTKERKLPKDLAKRERAARKAAGLYAPSRSPKQQVAMEMTIRLDVQGQEVRSHYQTSLGKHSLRMKVAKPKKGSSDAAVAFLSNARLSWVWGLPSSKGEDKVQLERAAFERKIEHTFRRAPKRGTVPGDLRTQFGDHLLPVLWVYPLPAWIGDLVHTLDLGGEAVIEGKQLISDGTQAIQRGYRKTRVEGLWTKASSDRFTMKYKLDVEQFMSQTRDGKPLQGAKTTYWLFEIQGVATYSFRDQAWESIDETVHARPKDLDDERLRSLHDEVYTGTIRIRRAGTKDAGTKKKRRRRR